MLLSDGSVHRVVWTLFMNNHGQVSRDWRNRFTSLGVNKGQVTSPRLGETGQPPESKGLFFFTENQNVTESAQFVRSYDSWTLVIL